MARLRKESIAVPQCQGWGGREGILPFALPIGEMPSRGALACGQCCACALVPAAAQQCFGGVRVSIWAEGSTETVLLDSYSLF